MIVKRRNIAKRQYALLSLLRTNDMLARYMGAELGKYNVSLSSFGVMNALITHDGKMTPTGIGKWMFRSKHAVNSLLHTLEVRGSIKLEPNNQDRRSKQVKLTEKGLIAVNEVMPTVRMMTEVVFRCLDDEEIETLNDILKRLRKHLYKQFDNPKKNNEVDRLPKIDSGSKSI